MDRALTERVKLTQKRLRKRTITAVLNEFDHKIMRLGTEKREEKYRKMSLSPFSFFAAAPIYFIWM